MTPEPVMDPAYWSARLAACDGELHRAMFHGSIDQLTPIEEEQRRVLAREIRVNESVLDAGCGYGRLLDLMRPEWHGYYLGIDICPEFIALAKQRHPGRKFVVADLRNLDEMRLSNEIFLTPKRDVAVCLGVRGMLRRNGLHAEWDAIERELLTVARRVLVPETPDKRFEGE